MPPLTQQEWTTIIHNAIPSFLPPPTPSSSSLTSSSLTSSSLTSSSSYSPALIAQTIDHTLLRLDATGAQIDNLCAEAIRYKFKTVCVRVGWVSRCVENLRGNGDEGGVGICCVIGFHEGTYSTEEKVKEAQTAISHGATELDLVLNHHLLHQDPNNNNNNPYPTLFAEILAIRNLPSPNPITLKLILETSQLSPAEIISACILASSSSSGGSASADFVKTSTGFCGRGATVDDVLLMKTVVDKQFAGGKRVKVKASGGVKELGDWKRMIGAGAERVGTSSGVGIVREAEMEEWGRGRGGGYGVRE